MAILSLATVNFPDWTCAGDSFGLGSDTLQISDQQVESARTLLALVHHQIKATRQMWQLGGRSHQHSGLE
jgi:hypothetical protein